MSKTSAVHRNQQEQEWGEEAEGCVKASREKRYAGLDILLKKCMRDNALGGLPDKRYEMLSAGYIERNRQGELGRSIKTCRGAAYAV